MIAAGTAGGHVNVLRRELEAGVNTTTTASAQAVYDLLADLSSHQVWGGDNQSETARLVAISAPPGPAIVGTEFSSTGTDPMGEFHDRSVVTEASRPAVFEFVTEAHLLTKKGATADWTNVHRYEITPRDSGCRVTYTIRIVRISALPGLLAIFNIPVLSSLGMKAAAKVARKGLTNLVAMAEGDD